MPNASPSGTRPHYHGYGYLIERSILAQSLKAPARIRPLSGVWGAQVIQCLVGRLTIQVTDAEAIDPVGGGLVQLLSGWPESKRAAFSDLVWCVDAYDGDGTRVARHRAADSTIRSLSDALITALDYALQEVEPKLCQI